LARFGRLWAASVGGHGGVTTLTAFSLTIWRKGGPRCDYTWGPVRDRIARTYHLLMDLRGRPCSKRHRLPCVPEGGSFFAAAPPAGEWAPSETIERYAFLRMRRACAPVRGARKSWIFGGFPIPLVGVGEKRCIVGLRAMVSAFFVV